MTTAWALDRWKQQRALRRWSALATFSILLTLAALASWGCGVHLWEFTTGLGKGLEVLGFFVPPETSAIPQMFWPAASTVLVGLAATLLGAALSAVVALAAASNVAPPWMRFAARLLIGVERGIPEIVILLFCIAVFGVGVLPGLLALTISSVSMLGKLLADAIEEADPQPIESVRATGATLLQVIRYGILPQVMPAFLANSAFRFEVNVRASVLLGAAGAGGIGYELSAAMAALEYRRATIAIGLSLLIIFSAERASDTLRHRLIAGDHLQ